MSQVPDAWDDGWVNQADTSGNKAATPPSEKKVSAKVTKAQRRAEQAEFNRQLWEQADNETQQPFHYAETQADVPLKQDIKPTITLLSRRPQIANRQTGTGLEAATAGMNQLGLEGEGDSDEENNKAPEPTPEERHAMALKDREERRRKYEEARERLFGTPSATTSGNSSPGTTSPPRQTQLGEGRGKGRGRGRGRDYQKRDSSSASSKSRPLYDPSPVPKITGPPPLRLDKSGDHSDAEKPTSPAPQKPTRNPRGPDASGRGGFRFNRGARTG